MYVDTDRTSVSRPPRTEFDRRAIAVTAQLLAAGLWLERQLSKAPRRLTELVDGPNVP